MNKPLIGTTVVDKVTSEAKDRIGLPVGPINDRQEAYRKLQILIGIVAVTLVPLVVGIDHIFGEVEGLRGSVSSYYYGRGGNWFVGGLCAMAVFFVTYEYNARPGRDWDNIQSTLAAACAAIVALVPTPSDPRLGTSGETILGYIHGIAAALLFVFLAVFSLYQFTKTGPFNQSQRWAHVLRTDPDADQLTPEKVVRNMIYRACGVIIVVALCVALVSLFVNLGRAFFWAEVVAVSAFGLSWLVKGGAFWIFNDTLMPPERDP